jgi:hypothetical protein
VPSPASHDPALRFPHQTVYVFLRFSVRIMFYDLITLDWIILVVCVCVFLLRCASYQSSPLCTFLIPTVCSSNVTNHSFTPTHNTVIVTFLTCRREDKLFWTKQ